MLVFLADLLINLAVLILVVTLSVIAFFIWLNLRNEADIDDEHRRLTKKQRRAADKVLNRQRNQQEKEASAAPKAGRLLARLVTLKSRFSSLIARLRSKA